MIELRKITNDNFNTCVKLNPGEGNEKYVAPNIKSLAQAYVAIENDTCTPIPFAIYYDDVMVGFIQLAYVRKNQEEVINEPIYEVWRFMIDYKYQGKGYGKAALKKAIEYIRTFPHGTANKVYTSYISGNGNARCLYAALGFKETGDIYGNDILMVLDLTV